MFPGVMMTVPLNERELFVKLFYEYMGNAFAAVREFLFIKNYGVD